MADSQPELRALFCEALDRQSAGERAEYLDQACQGKPEMRARVEALLRAHAEASVFLQEEPGNLVATIDEPLTERPGSVIGPYKLLEQIGEGGFGVVFMAEQTTPLRRKVALKVIKPGMDTRQVIARFEAERQALALMEHPNIARVLDAGTTEARQGDTETRRQGEQDLPGGSLSPCLPVSVSSGGRPYFVMELVRGTSMTDYCDQNNLPIHERLELFVDVCQAVQHAHQKGIIHRDIKPSNVLVTLHDGKPVVKVIDFGIAKAMGQQLTEKTLFTNFAQMIGTPLYMSPEQAEMSGLDTDTRSDIYSLGVLLYELLTGTTPFDKERLKKAGFDEIRRIIREEEPPKPSTRMSTVDQAASTASEKRGSDPRKLSRLFRGELDWIVMKALEKDRNRRYETASAFAADVGRYLKDEAVLACPPSVGYRLRKFVRRNKRTVMAAVCLLVTAAAVVGNVGYLLGDRAARQRTAEAKVVEALEAAEPGLRDGNPWDHALVAASQQAQAQLDSGLVGPTLRKRAEQLVKDVRMLAELERIQLEQASVRQGHFDWPRAAPEYARAFRAYGIDAEVLEPEDAAAALRNSTISEHLVEALEHWAYALTRDGSENDTQQARKMLTVARHINPDPWRNLLRDQVLSPNAVEIEQLVRSAPEALAPDTVGFLATLQLDGRVKRGNTVVDLLRRAQQRYPASFWINHHLGFTLANSQPPRIDEAIGFYRAAVALWPDSSGAHANLAYVLMKKGDADGAIAECRAAIRISKDYAIAHNNLGNALSKKGLLDEAINEYRDALHLKRDYPGAHINLGTALEAKGRLDEAINEYREAIQLRKDLPEAHSNLGNALTTKGCLDEAIAECQQAIRIRQDFPEAHNNLGNALQDKGRVDEAIAEYQEAIRIYEDLPDPHNNLGNALSKKGLLDEAIYEYREALRLKSDYPDAHNNLGTALAQKGRMDEAIEEFQDALRLNQDFALAHCNLGHALQAQGRFADALAALKRGHEIGSKNPHWSYQSESAEWVRAAEHMVAAEVKLPMVLKGQAEPADVGECVALAHMCQEHKGLYHAASQFYADAFAEQPKLADDLQHQYRYNAACAAALAGCGQGKDANQSDDKERTRLRRQALDWLRADLTAWGQLLQNDPDKTRLVVAQTTKHWQEDADFAGVRGKEALAKLPEAEREEWQKLWTEVEAMRQRATGQAKPKVPDGH